MKPLAYSKVRRVMKWVGLLTCALLVLMIVLSRWWSISWSGGNYWGYVQWGGIAFGYHNRVDQFSWRARRNSFIGLLVWWFEYEPGNLYVAQCFITPLWLPLAVIGVPTILAWKRDRRHPAGHCQGCGYNLTGNESGVCPECGSKTEQHVSIGR